MGIAEEHIRAGKLAEALTELQGQVRKLPADPKPRVFLFQLLSVLGQWDRAQTQLGVLGDLDPTAIAMVQTYREVLRCELLRAEVFAGKRTPMLFGKPADWMALLVQAVKLAHEERFEEAEQLRGRAFEEAPATAGTIDGQAFQWLADGDSRLGPMLEAVVNGRYYWIPFSRLREISLDKPVDLRDLVWAPAHLTYANGGQTVALIPSRYPGTEKSADPRLLLGRSTEWVERPGGLFQGLGQRQLATDGGEFALMDVRVIQLQSAADEGEEDQAPTTEPPAGPAEPAGG